MLEAVIIAKFKKGPGWEKVHSGEFELFSSFDSSHVIDATSVQSTGLIPGTRITMAIIVGQYSSKTETSKCARAGCKSTRFRTMEHGGKIW